MEGGYRCEVGDGNGVRGEAWGRGEGCGLGSRLRLGLGLGRVRRAFELLHREVVDVAVRALLQSREQLLLDRPTRGQGEG